MRKNDELKRLQEIKNMENPGSEDLFKAYISARIVMDANITEYIEKTCGLTYYEYVNSVIKKVGKILENEYKPLVDAKNSNAPSNIAQTSISIVLNDTDIASTYRVKGGYCINNFSSPFIEKGKRFRFTPAAFYEPEKYFEKETAEKIREATDLYNEYSGSYRSNSIESKYRRTFKNDRGEYSRIDGIAYSEDPAVKKWIY